MVNFEIGSACVKILRGWGAWDELDMLVSLILSLVEVWRSFGRV